MIAEDLQVGTTYRVDASDCCVSVVFTSVLKEKLYYDDDPNAHPDDYRSLRALLFENGAVVDGHGVDYAEIETSE